jgi:hypothetical protein
MAAALNWILKDGIGQLGGILFGSWASSQLDADAKRWRWFSCVALDVSNLLESLTPLVPHLFLPLAAVANAGKNVSWLAASATRAAINLTLCRAENLADITGKSVSQAIACSLAGTVMGIGLSTLLAVAAPASVAAGAAAGAAPTAVVAVLIPLAGLHWWCCYRSLALVALNSLNEARAERLALEFMNHVSRQPLLAQLSLATPLQMRDYDHIVLRPKSALPSRLKVGMPLSEVCHDGNEWQSICQRMGITGPDVGPKHVVHVLNSRDVALVRRFTVRVISSILVHSHLACGMFAGMFVCLSFCLSVCLSFCLSVFLSVCLSVCLSFCLSVFLFVWMCGCG